MMHRIQRNEIPQCARNIGVNASAEIVLVGVTGEDYGEAAMRPKLVWPERPHNSVVISVDAFETMLDLLTHYEKDGAALGRLLIERTQVHDVLRVEDEVDYVMAFLEYGSLSAALSRIDRAVLQGGLEWFNAIYRSWFP